jgi:hypothetical protein
MADAFEASGAIWTGAAQGNLCEADSAMLVPASQSKCCLKSQDL